jgi:1-acyl-sn-glycerol-3-phosphate acyltransferase
LALKKAKNELEFGGIPDSTLYWIICKISRAFLKLKYNIKIQNKDVINLKPPFIVLGNHTSKLDPFIMAAVMYPHKVNYLGTNYYFRNPLLRPLLSAGGIIPKVQFFRDTRAVLRMGKVISRGGILGIFPEGRRSIDGTISPVSDAIAKLIKLYKVPVAAMVSKGGYLSLPRWSSFGRKGVIEVNTRVILTVEEVENLSIEDIKKAVLNSLYYNEYEWNREKRTSFKHKKIAEDLGCILHECPSCGRERSMLSKGNRLYCKSCGNAALMDEYGFMHPGNENCVIFEDTVKWMAWQKKRTQNRVMDEEFTITSKVKELRIADSLTGPYRKAGSGELVLHHGGLTLKGLIDGEFKEMFFPIHVMASIVSEFGLNLEITDGKNTYMFYLEDGQDVIRFELAIENMAK